MQQVFEGFEDGGLEGDALVGVGVVGGEVDGSEVGGTGFAEGGDKGVVGGSEAIVRGDDEHGTVGEFRGEIDGVPSGCVCEDLFGETLRGAAGERGQSAFSKTGGETGDCFFPLAGLGGVCFIDAHIGGGDEAYGFDGWVLRADVACDEAAHAVTDEDDVFGIGAELLCVSGVAHVGDCGLRVFDGVSEREVAG